MPVKIQMHQNGMPRNTIATMTRGIIISWLGKRTGPDSGDIFEQVSTWTSILTVCKKDMNTQSSQSLDMNI
jgi:hypothetical protein